MRDKSTSRTKDQIAKDRETASEMYLKGFYLRDIAEKLGISISQVSRDLSEVRKQWEQSSLRNFAEARSEELARLNQVELEAWRAWEGDEEGSRNPNPHYLRVIERCIERRCKILGLESPEKYEHSGQLTINAESPRERIAGKLSSIASKQPKGKASK